MRGGDYDYDNVSDNESDSVFIGRADGDEMKKNWCSKYDQHDDNEVKMMDDVKITKSDDELEGPVTTDTVTQDADDANAWCDANLDILDKDECKDVDSAHDVEDNLPNVSTYKKSLPSRRTETTRARNMDDPEVKNIFDFLDSAYEKIHPVKRKEAASSPDKELLQGAKVARVTST